MRARHQRSRTPGVGVVALVLAASSSLLGGCENEEPSWVSQVESAHSGADRAASPDEHRRAREALERAFAAVPDSQEPRQTWVRQDLCVRIGAEALSTGDATAALVWAERGLGLSPTLNVARADLLGLKGRALEALGRKEEAVQALHEALTANQALMERALQGKNLDEATP